jgi:hypothetical protein
LIVVGDPRLIRSLFLATTPQDINDVTFVVQGRSPSEVFLDLQSAPKLAQVALKGRGKALEVTKVKHCRSVPLTPHAARL